jgi:hypothetical protein
MIWIDPRTGSHELRPLFSAFSIPVTEEERLECGDFLFFGRGVNKLGKPDDVSVGIEIPTTSLSCSSKASGVPTTKATWNS